MGQPFKATGATVNIDVSSSNQEVKISDAKGGIDVRIVNNGTATAWVAFGVTGGAATLAGSMPVGPGVHEVQHAPELGTALYAQVIAAGSTGKIYFTPGTGI